VDRKCLRWFAFSVATVRLRRTISGFVSTLIYTLIYKQQRVKERDSVVCARIEFLVHACFGWHLIEQSRRNC
jgi:hypothetical protein